jgi:tetratricopeptide (TPR) repeat protein
MNAEIRMLAVVMTGIVAASMAGIAQRNGVSPFESQIRGQESVVASDSGKVDGTAWLKLAVLYQDAARYDDAERAFEKAVRLLKTKDHNLYAEALDHMGTMYVERGKFDKAEPLEKKALALREDAKNETALGTSYMHLAVLAYGRHDLAGANANAEMAVSLLAPTSPRDRAAEATPEEKMSALVDLSLIKCARGECADAVPELNRALAIAHANYQANSMPVGFLDFLLGNTYWKNGDSKHAPALMKRGIDEMQQALGWGHPTYIAALKQYRSVLAQIGSTAEAEAVNQRIALLELSSKFASLPEKSSPFGISAFR